MKKTLPKWKGFFMPKNSKKKNKARNIQYIRYLNTSLVFWPPDWIRSGKYKNYAHHHLTSGPATALPHHLQIHRLVRKNLTIMIALFIIAISVFIYMIYVLIKPEKF